IASYAWTQVNGPATATIVSASSASTSVTGLTIAGDYTFRLTVTDNGTPALSDTDDIIVTVDAAQNVAPQADAGPDRTITLPTSSVTLDGSGSSDTAPGTIASYAWTQVNGPTTATIVSASSASTSVTGLTIAGDYTFRLTVTDNGTPALSDTDDIIVTVDAAQNEAPQADAGLDRTITLPTSSVTLDGSGSSDTAPGNIDTYAWTQVNGPTTATIASTGDESPSVTGLTIAGQYTFRLTVTDNNGAQSNDLVVVTVNPLEPKAIFSGPTNVSSPSQLSVSGTVTVLNGSMTFNFSGTSATRTGTLMFTIDGTSYALTLYEGETKSQLVPQIFTPGTYNYSLSISGSGTLYGGVSAQQL
ncbi:PKD domain-containing protein, partial [Zobellia sp. B3R18]|uniref:PKD domain-containing protein n=1 Tax=Zobellia sp. B3R18 TaxID=2841568 RepID=UPI001D38D3F3